MAHGNWRRSLAAALIAVYPGVLRAQDAGSSTAPPATPTSVDAPAPPEVRPSVAVLPLSAENQVAGSVASLLSETLVATVRQTAAFSQVVSYSEVQTMLGFEQQKQMLNCAEDSCMAELANSLGVDFLFAGSVGRLGNTYVLHMKLLNIRRATVAATLSEHIPNGSEEMLLGKVQSGARTLVLQAGLATAPSEPVAPPRKEAGIPPLVPAGAVVAAAGALGVVPVMVALAVTLLAVTLPYVVYVPTPGLGGMGRRYVFPGVGLAGGLGGVVLGVLALGGVVVGAGMLVVGWVTR